MHEADSREMARELLSGGYDLHVHSAPSHVPRVIDDLELVAEATEAHMAGVMIKNHYESTGSRAALLNARAPAGSAVACGGLVLNWPVGGLNPYAVESAVRLGARMVWMPTRDSAHSLRYGNMPGDFFNRPGIAILDEQGRLLPAVHEIIALAAEYDIPLATGHLSVAESIALCRECVARRVKVVLTHPEFKRTVIPLETQVELAGMGVFIEKCWLNIAEGDCTEAYMAMSISEIGAEHVFLTTDCGKLGFPRPVEGMLQFIVALFNCGLTAPSLKYMLQNTPKAVLAIP